MGGGGGGGGGVGGLQPPLLSKFFPHYFAHSSRQRAYIKVLHVDHVCERLRVYDLWLLSVHMLIYYIK